MKRYNAIYFLLFLLLVMGAFASMAQNSYGLKIIGGVAFLFGGLFLLELIQVIARPGKKDGFAIAELAAMAVFAIVLGCGVFMISIPGMQWIFAGAGAFLVFFYTRKLFIRFRRLVHRNRRLAWLGALFHFSIILFLLTIVVAPFSATVATLTGWAGIITLLLFIAGTFLKKYELLEGNKVTVLQMVSGYRDHSIVLALLFLLVSLFSISQRAGILPGLYLDEYPRAFYDIMGRESAGSAAERKERQAQFREQYDLLLKHLKEGGRKK